MGPPQDEAPKPSWRCKTCKRADGLGWVSSGLHKFCSKCGLRKKDKFDCNLEPATVSTSARQVVAAAAAAANAWKKGGPDLAAQLKGQLKEAQREISALRKSVASPPVAAAVIDVDEMDTAEPDESFEYSIDELRSFISIAAKAGKSKTHLDIVARNAQIEKQTAAKQASKPASQQLRHAE